MQPDRNLDLSRARSGMIRDQDDAYTRILLLLKISVELGLKKLPILGMEIILLKVLQGPYFSTHVD